MNSIFKIMNEFRIVWFCFLCFLLFACGCTYGSSVCEDTGGRYKNGSSYESNLRDILKSLAINVTLEDGFYNTTIGQDPDRVYALALCREGYKTKDCYNCISTLSQSLTTECPNQTSAYSWDGDVPCLIRYSDHPIYGSLDLYPARGVTNTGDINSTMSNLTRFDEIWQSLMLRTMTAASAGTSKLIYYGTGTEKLTANDTIYTLMQCTPDISQSECRLCLRESVGAYQSCCYGKRGGVFTRPSCVFRWDMYPFYGAFDNISTTSPPPSPALPSPALPNNQGEKKKRSSKRVILSVATVVPILLIILCFCILRKRKNKAIRRLNYGEDNDDLITADSLRFDIGAIRDATDNFSPEKELGRGGFGSVYKGTLWDGEEIAVKRLSKNSGQGDSEFKTEVMLVAKLQHRNLVRLLGFCLDGSERILVYEFVPNSSLDHFLFDPVKRTQLDWETRSRIIQGIARGLLYLHEDSRLRVIHRDLKAGNILLDNDMCPKIADFGLARLFGKNETQGSTNTIVGTYGYMAPEYAMHGQFSVKTDVFSFGVMVLEIISGRKNRCIPIGEDAEDLLSFAWRSWSEESEENFLDPTLISGPVDELKRCINIGLLCVQDKVAHRPTMALVVQMLNSASFVLPKPSRPALFRNGVSVQSDSVPSNGSRGELLRCSVNECTMTQLHPR